MVRNPLVATPAQQVSITHPAPAGKTEAFGRPLLAAGNAVFALDSDDTHNLQEMSARCWRPACESEHREPNITTNEEDSPNE
jgi:hypothetical protein